MSNNLTLSCGNQTTNFKVDLKNMNNLNGVFERHVTGPKRSTATIFNFSQNKCEIKDKNLYTQICEALKKLQSLAGKKDVIDDADFNKAMFGQSYDKNWCCDSSDYMTISYSPDKEKSFFNITPKE